MMAVWLIWLLAQTQAAAGYAIAGTVVNAAGGQPVNGAHVTLVAVGQKSPPLSTISGEDGKFTFAGLPRGMYGLAAERRGFLSHAWGQTGSAGAIVTGPGQYTPKVILRLAAPAAVSGKIVDEAGDPVAEARVELLGTRIVEGHREPAEGSFKLTDDTGAYRFSSLAAGSYYLVVTAVPWYAKFTATFGESAPAVMTHAGYGVRYYPNVGDAAAAEPVVLAAGQEAVADFTLHSVPAGTVSVHCEGSDDLIKHYTLAAAGAGGRATTVREGSEEGDLYNLFGIPAGNYTIHAEASDNGRNWYGAAEFDTAGGGEEVDVVLHPAPSLRGMIAVDGGVLPAGISVMLRGPDGRRVSAPVDARGQFSVATITPGRYRLKISADEYSLQNWSVTGGRRENDDLTIPDGAAVRVSMSIGKGVGRVAGIVRRGEEPLWDALVVIDSAGSTRAIRSNSDGSFEFRGLPLGEYAVYAVEDGSNLEYANPAAAASCVSRARQVRVTRSPVADLQIEAGPG